MRFLLTGVAALLCVSSVNADLRAASHPSNPKPGEAKGTPSWKTKSRGRVSFVNPTAMYMEPSAFGYAGLTKQRKNNYDNFLRSNIDNEQNRRNFVTEAGRDHLPFRSFEGGFTDAAPFAPQNTAKKPTAVTGAPAAGGITDILTKMPPTGNLAGPLAATFGSGIETEVGTPFTVPLRWNNPHSSELEVNIWVKTDAVPEGVVVVPIRLPTCSGEGYQDNVFSFKVPADFLQLPQKIPNFTGCKKVGDCVLQVYAHSVESRQYAFGTPIVVKGTYAAATATGIEKIASLTHDVGTKVDLLPSELCLSSSDPSADIGSAAPQRARLVSDQFTHAYISANDPYSPYSGQQPTKISRNLQYACLNRGITGNRGELGKSLLTSENKNLLKEAAKKQANLVKRMEGIVNKIIQNILQKDLPPSTDASIIGSLGAKTAATTLPDTQQRTAACFRCAQVGATSTNRLKTNTYVPSFTIGEMIDLRKDDAIAQAKKESQAYPQLVSNTGDVLIYKTVYELMGADYKVLQDKGLFYLTAAIKPAMTTLVAVADGVSDPMFKKVDQDGKKDQGKYAAGLANAWYKDKMAAAKIQGTFANPGTFPTPPAAGGRRLLATDADCYTVSTTDYTWPTDEEKCRAANAAKGIECSCDGADPGDLGTCPKCDNNENDGALDDACAARECTAAIQIFAPNGGENRASNGKLGDGCDPAEDGGCMTAEGKAYENSLNAAVPVAAALGTVIGAVLMAALAAGL